jgi:hypothetical protein
MKLETAGDDVDPGPEKRRRQRISLKALEIASVKTE